MGHTPGQVKRDLVDVTPSPILARLEGPDHRVGGGVKVLRRMFVFGRIAAAHVSARKTQPQVDPGVANLQAVFTAVSARRDFANLI